MEPKKGIRRRRKKTSELHFGVEKNWYRLLTQMAPTGRHKGEKGGKLIKGDKNKKKKASNNQVGHEMFKRSAPVSPHTLSQPHSEADDTRGV